MFKFLFHKGADCVLVCNTHTNKSYWRGENKIKGANRESFVSATSWLTSSDPNIYPITRSQMWEYVNKGTIPERRVK